MNTETRMEQEEVVENLAYQGFDDVALLEDGSWVSPASSAYGQDYCLFVWTSQGYRHSEGE